MTTDRRVRLRDVRDVYQLIGHCREVGDNSDRWHRRAMEGICELVKAPCAIGGEGIWPEPGGGSPHPLHIIDVGYSPVVKTVFVEYAASGGLARDPFLRGMEEFPGRLVTKMRRQVVGDEEWLKSEAHAVRVRAGLGDEIKSIYRLKGFADRRADVITIHRKLGDPPFTQHDRRIVRLFHNELGRLMGRTLMMLGPTAAKLSPRQHQVLSALLQGDSEKEAARRLGIKAPTVHQYVTALYRHFNVASRGELLTMCLANRNHSSNAANGNGEHSERQSASADLHLQPSQ